MAEIRQPSATAPQENLPAIADAGFTVRLDANLRSKVVEIRGNATPPQQTNPLGRHQNWTPIPGEGMFSKRWRFGLAVMAAATLAGRPAEAREIGDIKINIPKHSKLTPVQRLNREGVEAVRKHNYKKAEELFYKAYLFDPGDAFTLTNLGYIAELQ